jgi:hypothetical protein
VEATRAAVAALPLLREAEGVSILTTPDLADRLSTDDVFPGDLDLRAALEWQGVHAHAREVSRWRT